MKSNLLRKITIKFTAILSVVLVLVPSLSAFAANTELIDRTEHSDENFEDYEYVWLYEEDFDEIVSRLDGIVDDASKASDVLDIIEEMDAFLIQLNADYAIAQIYSDMNVGNEEYKDMVTHADELFTSAEDKQYMAYNSIANSVNSDVLKEYINDDEEWQEILDYVPLTEEQKEWSKLETELELQYDEIYNSEYTYVASNGKSYDMDSVDTAVDRGEVSYDEYFECLSYCIGQRNRDLANLYLELVDVRTKLARSYGYDNYADYAYDKIYDRDYTPQDLDEYRAGVREYYSDFLNEVYDKYFDEFSDSISAAWDVSVSEQDVYDALEAHLDDVSPDMWISYNYMREHNLIDISMSDSKSPGAYTMPIAGYNAPYIFNCAEGDFSDIGTLVHEFGHYNEMYLQTQYAWDHDTTDLDLAEVHSQGLELIYTAYDDEMYGRYADAIEMYNILNQVYIVVEGAKEDAFQYMVYTNPDNLSVDRLNEMYYDVCDDYKDLELYNSYYLGMYGYLDSNQIYEWVEIPHTFQQPMYYISYSISMSGVEELRVALNNDREDGIDKYLQLVMLGGEESFSEAFDTVGLNNPIDNPRFEYYVHNVRLVWGEDDGYVPDNTAVADSHDDEDVDDDDDDDDYDYERPNRDRAVTDNKAETFDLESIMPYLIGVAGGLVLIIIIIIIVALATSKKKKKSDGSDVKPNEGKTENIVENKTEEVASDDDRFKPKSDDNSSEQ